MLHVIIAALMQVSSGDPAAAPAAQAPPPAKAAEGPKMICRWQPVTGSLVKKERVCVPLHSQDDPQSSALQRALSRSGDIPPPAPLLGN
jgi:hypothetical protein